MNIECRIKNREKRIMNNEGFRGASGKRLTVEKQFTGALYCPSIFNIHYSTFDIQKNASMIQVKDSIGREVKGSRLKKKGSRSLGFEGPSGKTFTVGKRAMDFFSCNECRRRLYKEPLKKYAEL